MKSKYKSTKIHNKQSGNSPKACTYYELDEIFGNSPAIIPDATCSNLQGIVLEKKRKESTTSANDVETAAASTSCGTGKSHLQLKKMETEDTKVEHVVMPPLFFTVTNLHGIHMSNLIYILSVLNGSLW